MNPGDQSGWKWKGLAGHRMLKIGIAYLVVAWVIIQVAEVILPSLRLPEWSVTLVVVMAVLGLPLALFLGWASSGREKAAAIADQRSIAVLPFADMSEGADQAYFCEGMAEEIINDLVRVERLNVASRTSSFSYRNSDLNAVQIGRELNVGSILEGSVRKAGNRLRVTAQLIGVQDGYHLWSERYDREFDDVFEIQDEIARNIVKALRIRLSPEETRAMALPMNCTPAAYEHYLKGRHQFHRFGRRNLEAAVSWFEKALEECETFAPAYAGLADALSHIYMFLDARDEYRTRALENAERALELDPDSPETRTSIGLARMLVNDFESSERAFLKALELNPESFDAHYLYARMLWTQGRLDEAIEQFGIATDLNPEDYQSPNLLVSLLRGRDDARARRYSEIAVRRSLAQLEREPDDIRAMYLMTGALVRLGREDEAIHWAERAVTLQPTSDTYYNVACTYVLMGRHDRALDMLEAAAMQGKNYAWMANDPDLEPLRGHPRFEAVLETIR
jgi:adenylate cyclase